MNFLYRYCTGYEKVQPELLKIIQKGQFNQLLGMILKMEIPNNVEKDTISYGCDIAAIKEIQLNTLFYKHDHALFWARRSPENFNEKWSKQELENINEFHHDLTGLILLAKEKNSSIDFGNWGNDTLKEREGAKLLFELLNPAIDILERKKPFLLNKGKLTFEISMNTAAIDAIYKEVENNIQLKIEQEQEKINKIKEKEEQARKKEREKAEKEKLAAAEKVRLENLEIERKQKELKKKNENNQLTFEAEYELEKKAWMKNKTEFYINRFSNISKELETPQAALNEGVSVKRSFPNVIAIGNYYHEAWHNFVKPKALIPICSSNGLQLIQLNEIRLNLWLKGNSAPYLMLSLSDEPHLMHLPKTKF